MNQSKKMNRFSRFFNQFRYRFLNFPRFKMNLIKDTEIQTVIAAL